MDGTANGWTNGRASWTTGLGIRQFGDKCATLENEEIGLLLNGQMYAWMRCMRLEQNRIDMKKIEELVVVALLSDTHYKPKGFFMVNFCVLPSFRYRSLENLDFQ